MTSTSALHLIRERADGRGFILAGELPERIGRRCALWSYGHVIVFVGAGITSLLLFSSGTPAP